MGLATSTNSADNIVTGTAVTLPFGRAMDPAWQQLRWDLEELRVSMFAQELGTRRQVSAKRLARQLEALT